MSKGLGNKQLAGPALRRTPPCIKPAALPGAWTHQRKSAMQGLAMQPVKVPLKPPAANAPAQAPKLPTDVTVPEPDGGPAPSETVCSVDTMQDAIAKVPSKAATLPACPSSPSQLSHADNAASAVPSAAELHEPGTARPQSRPLQLPRVPAVRACELPPLSVLLATVTLPTTEAMIGKFARSVPGHSCVVSLLTAVVAKSSAIVDFLDPTCMRFEAGTSSRQ